MNEAKRLIITIAKEPNKKIDLYFRKLIFVFSGMR